MMVWDPSAGGFIEFSARYVDPALGFAMGWQFWFQVRPLFKWSEALDRH